MNNKTIPMTENQAFRLAIAAIINSNGSFAAVRRELAQHGVELVHPKDCYLRKISADEISVRISEIKPAPAGCRL